MSGRHASATPVRAPAWLPLVALALAGAVLVVQLALTVAGTGRALLTFDSAEYAVAGRTTARLGRLATTFVLPHESTRPSQPPFPLILGHPLVPLANALMFRLGGERVVLTLVPPALAMLALAVAVAFLAVGLGAGPAMAVCAVATLVLHPRLLYVASEGLTEIPFAAALTMAAVALTRPVGRTRALGFGVALGIAHLARPVMAPLLPAWLAGLALVSPPGARWRRVGWALAGFVPCAAALALYKTLAAGDPLADVARDNLLVGLDPRFTPLAIQCAVAPPTPLEWLTRHPAAMPAKLARELPGLLVGAWGQAGWLWPPALAGALIGFTRRERRGAAMALVGSTVLLAVLVAASLPSRRYLLPLLPFEIAFAFAGLAGLGRRLGGAAPIATLGAIALVITTAAIPTARDWRWALTARVRDRGVFDERTWRDAGVRIALGVPPGSLIASDAGAFVAWYADRPAVLLPARPEDLPALETRLPLEALVLTNEWLLDQPGFEAWARVAHGDDTPPGWRRVHDVASGRLHAAVLLRVR
ncbi:MAG: hypothetical protein ACHQ52_05220 [Candidatus Eisenbacteria bacterium]